MNQGIELLFATPSHTCSYLPGRRATTLVVNPRQTGDSLLYDQLSQVGFRRSGDLIYRPQCGSCQACIPVRIPVTQFEPRRSQRRTWCANQDLRASLHPPVLRDEHFQLYQRYLQRRHRDSQMLQSGRQQTMEVLTSPWSNTFFCEFRSQQQLLAVAVLDRLCNGLSAVYTFFDPDFTGRGLGVFALLWTIAECRRLGLDWLYLGYWIEGCATMHYKMHYRPQERFVNSQWTRYD